jgi:ATP/ADP translocase
MKRWLSSIIDVRRGEITLTLLMFFYYYLLLVTYYFLKPARDSLFLVKLGAIQLPIVFMLIAVIVVPVTTLYARASHRLKLITRSTFGSASMVP